MEKICIKVPAESGYVPMEEGTYVFRIKELKFSSDGKRCTGVYVTEDGGKLVEKYNIYDENEEVRPAVVTSLARVIAGAMDMDNLPENITEKSVENCVGRYIMAYVRHSEYNGRVFDHLDSYSIEPAEGYTGEETEEEDTVDEEDTDEDDLFDDED